MAAGHHEASLGVLLIVEHRVKAKRLPQSSTLLQVFSGRSVLAEVRCQYGQQVEERSSRIDRSIAEHGLDGGVSNTHGASEPSAQSHGIHAVGAQPRELVRK